MVAISADEIELVAVRAQGAGGQNVNKVATAIHLRFDIRASSLPEDVKQRLLALADRRISHEGVIIIKAQRSRSQESNRADAVARLHALVERVAVPPRARRPTRPTRGSKERRLQSKAKRSQLKAARAKPADAQ